MRTPEGFAAAVCTRATVGDGGSKRVLPTRTCPMSQQAMVVCGGNAARCTQHLHIMHANQ